MTSIIGLTPSPGSCAAVMALVQGESSAVVAEIGGAAAPGLRFIAVAVAVAVAVAIPVAVVIAMTVGPANAPDSGLKPRE